MALLLSVAGSITKADQITTARYVELDYSYSHLVLGIDHNWSAVELTLETGEIVRFQAPPELVYEDIAPHIIDIDADGQKEVMVVESGFGKGARIAIYGFQNSQLLRKAATPHIGQTNRWYAPIGAADLDGDGHIEIVFIDRPHLAKTLRIWRYEAGDFYEVTTLSGVTNHRIGEDFISSGLRICDDGTTILLADGTWRELLSVQLTNDTLTATPLDRYSQDALAQALNC